VKDKHLQQAISVLIKWDPSYSGKTCGPEGILNSNTFDSRIYGYIKPSGYVQAMFC